MARAVAFILLFLLVLAGVGFLMRDQEPVRTWLPREWRGAPPPAPQAKAQNPVTPSRPAGVHKCRRGAEVLYTSDAVCPPGSTEQAVERGAVNVLPSGGNEAKAAPQGETAADKLGEAMGRERARETRDRTVDRATR